MHSKLTPLAAVAAAATLMLGACNSGSDDAENAQANAAQNTAAPVTLKMIQASRTYRCKDNSLLYVDFYTNDTAGARIGQEGERTELTAADGQPPYTAEGWSISANADEITLTAPGKGTQTCRAG